METVCLVDLSKDPIHAVYYDIKCQEGKYARNLTTKTVYFLTKFNNLGNIYLRTHKLVGSNLNCTNLKDEWMCFSNCMGNHAIINDTA